MFRKYVIITLAALFFAGTTGCTSKKAQDDSAEVEASSDDESLESAEAVENNEDLETPSSDDSEIVADTGSDELAPEEKLPEESAETSVADNSDIGAGDLSETPPTDTLAGTEAPPPDTSMDSAPTPEPTDSGSDSIAATEPTPDSAPTPEPSYEEPAPKPTLSLQKIKSAPYREGKTLVNAVYIARAGDTVEEISQKVFGSPDRVKEICRVNSYNCSRGIKVGDKYYYNSPQRPSDDTAMKTFYEDAGIAPQTYTAAAGDNIRKVGKTLLGHERSWMELWATNDVESKGDLDEGTTLRYWPTTDAPAPTQTLAQTDAAPPPPADPGMNEPPPPMDTAMNEVPPPPQDMAMNEPPADPAGDLPPPPDTAMQGSVEPPPPPPPPPPPDMGNQGTDMAMAGEDPNQQTFMLGVGAVLLLAAAALFISIRKKRQRRQIDFNTSTQTQIE